MTITIDQLSLELFNHIVSLIWVEFEERLPRYSAELKKNRNLPIMHILYEF